MVAIIKTTDEFDNWLEKLKDRKAANIILARLHRIRSGLLGDAKFFNGIGELRIHYGAGYRIYFTKKAIKSLYCFVVVTNPHNPVIFKKPYLF